MDESRREREATSTGRPRVSNDKGMKKGDRGCHGVEIDFSLQARGQ